MLIIHNEESLRNNFKNIFHFENNVFIVFCFTLVLRYMPYAVIEKEGPACYRNYPQKGYTPS